MGKTRSPHLDFGWGLTKSRVLQLTVFGFSNNSGTLVGHSGLESGHRVSFCLCLRVPQAPGRNCFCFIV